MLNPQMIQQARKNGALYANWFGGQRPSVNGVVDLLVQGSQFHRHVAIRANSNKLLATMAAKQWTLTAGSHASTTGGPNEDKTNHYTVSVGGSHIYHLRHDAPGHLFQITGRGLPPLAPGVPGQRPPPLFRRQ